MKNKEGRVKQVLEKSVEVETESEHKFESGKKMDKSEYLSGSGQEEVKEKSELEGQDTEQRNCQEEKG